VPNASDVGTMFETEGAVPEGEWCRSTVPCWVSSGWWWFRALLGPLNTLALRELGHAVQGLWPLLHDATIVVVGLAGVRLVSLGCRPCSARISYSRFFFPSINHTQTASFRGSQPDAHLTCTAQAEPYSTPLALATTLPLPKGRLGCARKRQALRPQDSTT